MGRALPHKSSGEIWSTFILPYRAATVRERIPRGSREISLRRFRSAALRSECRECAAHHPPAACASRRCTGRFRVFPDRSPKRTERRTLGWLALCGLLLTDGLPGRGSQSRGAAASATRGRWAPDPRPNTGLEPC